MIPGHLMSLMQNIYESLCQRTISTTLQCFGDCMMMNGIKEWQQELSSTTLKYATYVKPRTRLLNPALDKELFDLTQNITESTPKEN